MILKYLEPSDVKKGMKDGMMGFLDDNLKKVKITRITTISGFIGFEFKHNQDAMEFHEHVMRSMDSIKDDEIAIELTAMNGRLSVAFPLGYLLAMGITVVD